MSSVEGLKKANPNLTPREIQVCMAKLSLHLPLGLDFA
jgi:hypothetical protein